MISLILTLFISLLSLGSPIFRLEENSESRISTITSDSLNSKPTSKSSIVIGNYIYFGFTELVTYDNFLLFTNNLKQYDYFPLTDVSVENFLLGTPARIYMANYDVSLGDTIDGEFNVNTAATSSFEYIEFSYDGSLDYQKYFDIIYRFGGNNFRMRAIYNFIDGYDSNPLCEYGSYTNTTSTYFDTATIKFNYSQFSSLFSPFNSNLNNYDLGYEYGYNYGYQTGLTDALTNYDYDSTALTIFTGITSIALTPINMFLQIFNFEILGINLAGFISGILTLAVVVIIIRLILGGKKND